jgi:hypothetical protein
VETAVNLTESEEKVRTAVANLFAGLPIVVNSSHNGSVLEAKVKGQEALIKFRNLLRNDRIRDAARRVLLTSTKNGAVVFCLNKQVAFAGHISFSEEIAESPMGPIKVTIKCDDPKKLVDWLAPRTA